MTTNAATIDVPFLILTKLTHDIVHCCSEVLPDHGPGDPVATLDPIRAFQIPSIRALPGLPTRPRVNEDPTSAGLERVGNVDSDQGLFSLSDGVHKDVRVTGRPYAKSGGDGLRPYKGGPCTLASSVLAK